MRSSRSIAGRWSGSILLLMLGSLGTSAMFRCLQAQSGEERRRGDLSPISLPGGSRVEFGTLSSQALGGEQPFSVFLPPSFSTDGSRTYPVVYFLHGLNNDHTSWTVPRYGDLPAKVDQMIQAGRIPEIIMVHPRGDNSFYCNFADGTKKYEDFVVKEVAAHVESHYRVRKDRASRAIAGTSMGGYGALQIAMKYPELYCAAAGHSPIILLARNPQDVPEELKAARFYQFFMSVLKPVFGDPIRQDLWDASNPLVLARKGNLKRLRIFIDYGTEDRYIQTIHLDQGVKALDQALTEGGVPHVFKEYAGEPHGWALVAAHLDESLPFLCQGFR
jgi:S-formylglutathione hydrolase FrmB